MNYRHSYHAGSFSDVVKHVFLTALVLHLEKKPTSFCYIDTHAGRGYYDLFSDAALKNKEYASGIEKIIQQDKLPPIIKRYIDCVHRINNELSGTKYSSLRFYPGSPMIVRQLMRTHDYIVACELQPQEYQDLRATFSGDKQVAVHHMDGFLGLKAFLPPREKRGLVLIDPPYENPDEFTRIAHSLPTALKRWASGLYIIWYPIKERRQTDLFTRTLQHLVPDPILMLELTIYPDIPNHLNGCGLAIINPPYQFETTAQEILPWLWKALTINKQGGNRVYQLK